MPSSVIAPSPEKPLQLYDIAACPFCRRVRETLSVLELDVHIYPCRRGGTRFRPRAVALGGKAQFPYLVDPNTGVKMYESADIVAYLGATYGEAAPAPVRRRVGVQVLTGIAATIRRRRGEPAAVAPAPVAAGQGPVVTIELYGFEASDECAVVRDVLCSLEIAYLLHNVAEGSARWAEFLERTGAEGAPFLVDPNNGAEKQGPVDIVDYLETTYGAG